MRVFGFGLFGFRALSAGVPPQLFRESRLLGWLRCVGALFQGRDGRHNPKP